MKSRAEAFELLQEYTKSDSLLKHALSVEASMRWYAKEHFKLPPEEVEKWEVTGLLHDFDYEMYPNLTEHPYKGAEILRERGYPEDIIKGVLSHADYTGVPRETEMEKTLFAVDELSGLVFASVLVRPDRSILTMDASSVKKKMKDKSFSRGCNREEIKQGAELLGVELGQHIANVIEGMRASAQELGLAGAS